MTVRKVLAILGVVLILGTIGALSGPRWQPEQVVDRIQSESTDTQIHGAAEPDRVGVYEVAIEDVDIAVNGVTVTARFISPVDGPEQRPGVLFMHGAGTGRATAFADQARDLASAGIEVVVPAKRLDTYSARHRDYIAMAQDYLVSFEALRQRPGVDASQVGIYGESEGAYIAVVAGAERPEVAFVALISAPVVPPREQFAFAADAYLRNTGAPTPLLRAIPRAIGASIPGGGFEYVDFDASPFAQRLNAPVLMVYGTDDAAMPVVQGVTVMTQDLAVAGNDDLTVRYYEGANHGIRSNGELVDGFSRDLSDWILGLPGTAGAPPQVAGAQPEQTYQAAPVARPSWYANGDFLLYGVLAAVGLLAIGPLVWMGNRLRSRGARAVMPPPLARFAAATALSSLAALAVFFAYLVQVAQYALDYQRNDVVVIGGYVLVLATGVLAAGVLYTSVTAWLDSRRSQLWHPVGRLIWWTTHLGAVSLLIMAAYWGVFPSFI